MTKPQQQASEAEARPEATTRVDFAHAAAGLEENPLDVPPAELLEAIAGHDAQDAPQQLRGQALELAAMLREKQRLLEQRESELNARTALLENELRTVRLKQYREDRADALPRESESSSATSAGGRLEGIPESGPGPEIGPRQLATGTGWESAEALRQWRVSIGREAMSSSQSDPSLIETELSDLARQAELDHWQGHSPVRAESVERATLDSASTDPAGPFTDAERQQQYEHLESQRQLLRQREEKLGRRQDQVEQMYEEVARLHREALELRLATEELWEDLSGEFPSDRLAEGLAQTRAKIADHYRLAHDTLAQRQDDLHRRRAELDLQEQRLRQQRREIQMWADRRYDEIEAKRARLLGASANWTKWKRNSSGSRCNGSSNGRPIGKRWSCWAGGQRSVRASASPRPDEPGVSRIGVARPMPLPRYARGGVIPARRRLSPSPRSYFVRLSDSPGLWAAACWATSPGESGPCSARRWATWTARAAACNCCVLKNGSICPFKCLILTFRANSGQLSPSLRCQAAACADT